MGPGTPAHIALIDARARASRPVYSSDAEDCWKALTAARRASRPEPRRTGNLTPDKAKDRQLAADGLSAPLHPLDGTTGVDTKYSR